jgi:hypothetical protein
MRQVAASLALILASGCCSCADKPHAKYQLLMSENGSSAVLLNVETGEMWAPGDGPAWNPISVHRPTTMPSTSH